MKFVLDASLTLAFCFEDEATDFTTATLRALPQVGAAVPTIWVHEVSNGLRSAQKRQRIREVAVLEFTALLGPLPIETIALAAPMVLGEVRLLALQHDLSVYDAAYLALAQHLGVPLGTLDGSGKRMGLKQAAAGCGVAVLTADHLAKWTRSQC